MSILSDTTTKEPSLIRNFNYLKEQLEGNHKLVDILRERLLCVLSTSPQPNTVELPAVPSNGNLVALVDQLTSQVQITNGVLTDILDRLEV